MAALSWFSPPALFLTVALISYLAHGIQVNQDGGYDLVVVINHEDSPPASVTTYIENIRTILQRLSIEMFIATENRFWLKSVEIVVPPTWPLEGTDVKDSLKTFYTADIRISSTIAAPNAENPNLCGLPGDFIELPTSFFNTANSGDYGESWKALLVLWTRYRWGAYEEHGYPGDETFPYFYRADNPGLDDVKWLTTGCTNAPDNKVVGKYVALNGTECFPVSENPLDRNCRFVPSTLENDDVTTSLMHFHWMSSITSFCDETTHKKNVPNRQNLLCDYKSVLETIRESPDATAITNPITHGNVPRVRTIVSKPSLHPTLYVLIDHGDIRATAQSTVISAVTEIGRFFTRALPNNLLAAVGSYPSNETVSNVKMVVPFQFVGGHVDEFISSIGNVQLVANPNRDFGVALRGAADEIKRINPLSGGAILILKTGGASNSATFTYEKDIEIQLRQQGIKLFAVEVSTGDSVIQNLQSIALSTAGGSVGVSAVAEVQSEVPKLLDQLATFVSGSGPADQEALPRIVWRGNYQMGSQAFVPVVDNSENLTFVLVSPSKRNVSEIFGGISTEQFSYGADFTESYEFADSENPKSRYVYSGLLDISKMKVSQVEFRVDGTGEGHLYVFSTGTNVSPGFDVEVSVSSTTVDLGSVGSSDIPFVIYAKVTQNQTPVTGAEVTATVMLDETAEITEVALYDDGYFNGEVIPGDGIYSGVVIPNKDGSYRISVTVRKGPEMNSAKAATSSTKFQLIPADQNFSPPVEPIEIPRGVVEVASLTGTVQFVNRDAYQPVIQKNRDVEVETAGSVRTFRFKAPAILGSNAAPSEYRLLRAGRTEDLINLNLGTDLPPGVTFVLNHTESNAQPGKTIEISYQDTSYGVFYYALVASESNLNPRLSNIVRVSTASDDATTVTSDDTTLETTGSGGSGGTTDSSGSGGTTDSSGSGGTTNVGGSDGTTVFPGTGTPPGPATTEGPDDSTPWIKTSGGIATVVIIVIVVFAGAGGGYWMLKRKQERSGSQTTLADSA